MQMRIGSNRRNLVLVLAGVLSVVSTPMAQEPAASDRVVDRNQISAIVARWEEAWNRHDMRAFASEFDKDGIWILWTGEVWTGRDAIENGHAAVHKTVFRNSIQRERLEELKFVGPDAAVVRFCSILTGDERAPGQVIRSRKFLVLNKRGGVWKIGWGQNTRLAETVPDSDCFMSLRKSVNGA
jgi:uncharacterized protein (TIGR02246 family)